MVNIPWIEYRVHFRNLMLSMYATCLAISGIGAAIQARRNDTRFLVAIVAPWLCWFVLLPQMNNRYMIWAAGFSALFVAVGLGMTLLGAIVAVVGWLGIARTMCESGGDPDLARLINPLTPHLAWLLMLAAAIYLYVAITPRRRMACLASKSLPESQPETSYEPKAAALV
jgi:hypothetical protein